MKKALSIAAGALLLLALVFKFIFVGYGVMALTLLFGAVCCVFFALLHGRKEKSARTLRFVVIAVLVVGFCCFMAAETPVFLGSHSDGDISSDYIIVMGAGVNGTEPSLSLQNRLETAYVRLQENPDAIAILSGGLGDYEKLSEAQCMFNWLTERGIDPDRLIREDQATNTYENIKYSLEILRARDFDPSSPVVIVSSDYHLCRIRMLAEHFGLESACVAARTPYISLYINCAIREAFALWEIWVFGFGA